MKLVLLGPPGTGKGTQADFLSKKYEIPQISTGDILRDAVRKNTVLGRKAKAYMDKGELVPDNIIISIIANVTNKKEYGKGYILDGFPRTKVQAEALGNITRVDYVIEIKTSDSTIVKRLSKRRQCSKCGAIYGIDFPPKIGNTCDKCGIELYQRDDDKEEAILNRLKVYRTTVSPLIEFYKRKGNLITVNGDQKAELTYKEIVEQVDRS